MIQSALHSLHHFTGPEWIWHCTKSYSNERKLCVKWTRTETQSWYIVFAGWREHYCWSRVCACRSSPSQKVCLTSFFSFTILSNSPSASCLTFSISHSMKQVRECFFCQLLRILFVYTHPFNSHLFGTTWVSTEQVPEETFIHSHPSWSSTILYQLHPLRSIVSSLFNLCAWQSFPQPLSRSSLVYPLVWGPLFVLHTFLHPVIIFFSRHMPIPSQSVLL